MGNQPIDFASLAQALLDRAEVLVPQWLPGGRRNGHEWVCANLSGGAGSSCSVNLVTGAWADFSTDEDRGGDLISLFAAIHDLNNGQAARRLMEELGWEKARAVQTPAPSRTAGAASEPPPWDADDPGPGAPDAPGGKRKSLWRAVVPVPPGAPETDGKHFHRGLPEAMWEYRFEDQFFGYVCRYRTSDGGKQVLPHTWCVDESDGRGTMRWHFKQWEEPRPLYVPATLLSGDPSNVPVVIVEGEKCAMAGHQLLGHEFDFVSWPGGSNAWDKAAWGWLMGRTVYLWPDCDAKRVRLSAAERQAGVDPLSKDLLPEERQPGVKAMTHIGSLLVAEHGCTVFMCHIPKPGDVSDGWDIADAIAQGWTADQVRAFIRRAGAFVPPDDAARARAGDGKGGQSLRGPGFSARSRATAEEGAKDPSIAWRNHLLETAQGSIRPVRENAVLALDGWPERGVKGVPEAEGLIRFNAFTNNVEKTRDTPWGTPAGPWEEADELLMGEWLVREHWLPSMPRGTLEEAVLMVAHRHAYHPVRERMEALRGKWDGQDRLERWLRLVCLEEDEYDDRDPLQQYLARVGKWFVMGMVARVMPTEKHGPKIVRGPGTKFDTMLILEGQQGWGKSSLAALLGGEWFADTGLMIGDKDSYQNIQGILVYEWGELENMTKQEVSKIKLFCSSWKDRFRASFDRRPRDYPRQVVFIGTTNETHYLTDVTGNRRFWPVRCTKPLDQEWLKANLDQLFAEAVHRLDQNERFWPTPQEQRELFDPQQRSRTVTSAIEAEIRRFLYDEHQKVPHGGQNGTLLHQVGMSELLSRIGYTIDKQTDVVVKKAASIMHALGWELKRTSQAGRPYVYVRPEREQAARPSSSEAGASPSSTGPTQANEPAEEPDGCPF